MPARTGKCINFGGCNKADSQEAITIPEGAEFVCPDCERSLAAIGGGKGKSGGGGGGGGKLKLIGGAILGLGVIGGLIAWLVTGNSPDVQSFAIEPTQISAGQTANLKWLVEHATDVSINAGIGAVQTEDSLPVSPRGTTTYTLTAKSGSHLVTKSVTLQVLGQAPGPIPAPVPTPTPIPTPTPNPTPAPSPRPGPGPKPNPAQAPGRVSGAPVIDQLTISPSTVQAGQPATLQWSTHDAISVSLPSANPPRMNLPPRGQLSFTLHSPGTINIPLIAKGAGSSVQRVVTLRVVSGGNSGPGPTVPSPGPGPGPQVQPVNPRDADSDTNPEPEPRKSAAASGTLIWEGEVNGTQLVTIENGVANSGQLLSGRLPGVPVILQQQNEKKVGIASPPSPENQYQRLVLRVFGHGHTRVVVNWSTP